MATAAFLGLLIAASVIYAVLWQLDFGGSPDAPSVWALWSDVGVSAALAGFGEVTVGVLAIVLTVVAILVQLAAYRYTPRITDIFGRDPVNIGTIGLLVLTAVLVIWVHASSAGPVFPSAMARVALIAVSLSLLGLLPYSVYIIHFLTPEHIIHLIQRDAVRAFVSVERRGESRIPKARAELRTAIEHLDDMAQAAVKKDDNAIAIQAIAALSEIFHANLRSKQALPPAWFRITDGTPADPDFVALHPDMMRSIESRHLWVDLKVMRGLETAFRQSLASLPDVAHLIAIHTRGFLNQAVVEQDGHAVKLLLRYFNTFLRYTINAGAVRSAYNVLNEYRTVARDLIVVGREDEAIEAASRMRYYAHAAFQQGHNFVVETAAHDVAALLEFAFERGAGCHDAMLDELLEIDRQPYMAHGHQEASIRGVRKAQIRLATLYLVEGAEHHARRIFDDMCDEPADRLRSLWTELATLDDPEWWEVANRDTNWDYLAPERRARLTEFFGWFTHLSAPPTEAIGD